CIFSFNSTASASTTRVAIMPFVNISADKNYEWISQGFSESLTSAFAQTGKLVVIERNQIKQLLAEQTFEKSGFVDEKNSVEIGKILGVDKLIVGSYQIFSGNISVNSRVVNIKTAQIDTKGAIANKRAKLENIFDLQEELCLIHSRELIENLSDNEKSQIAQVTSKSTNSLSAYEYYVKGKEQFQLLNTKSFARALEFYSKALEIDNSYALVYSDLAQMYGKWGYQRQQNGQEFESYLKQSIVYGQQAVKIAPNIGESHRGLAVAYFKNGDVKNAEAQILKAIELNPSESESYYFLWKIKNEDENSETIKRVLSLNPSFAPMYNDLGSLMEKNKNYPKAIEYFEKAIEINPGFT
ncbi:MAG: tetratricopeptide repeat protein, partial [Pedobacter sp.]